MAIETTRRPHQPFSRLRRRLYRGRSAKASIFMFWAIPLLASIPLWETKVQFFLLDWEPAKLGVRLTYYAFAVLALVVGLYGFREHERSRRLTRLSTPLLYWCAGVLAVSLPEILLPTIGALLPAG